MKFCDVVVYGTDQRPAQRFSCRFPTGGCPLSVFSLPLTDRLLAKAGEKYLKIFPASSPASSSNWLFRAFGRQVGAVLSEQTSGPRKVACVTHYAKPGIYFTAINVHNPGTKPVSLCRRTWEEVHGSDWKNCGVLNLIDATRNLAICCQCEEVGDDLVRNGCGGSMGLYRQTPPDIFNPPLLWEAHSRDTPIYEPSLLILFDERWTEAWYYTKLSEAERRAGLNTLYGDLGYAGNASLQ